MACANSKHPGKNTRYNRHNKNSYRIVTQNFSLQHPSDL